MKKRTTNTKSESKPAVKRTLRPVRTERRPLLAPSQELETQPRIFVNAVSLQENAWLS